MATRKTTATRKSTTKRRSEAEVRRRGREDGDAARVISVPKRGK